jgi:hypothetical protein
MIKFKHPRDKSDVMHYARIIKNVQQLMELNVLAIEGAQATIYSQSYSGFKEKEVKNLFNNIYIYQMVVNKFDIDHTFRFVDKETGDILATATRNQVMLLKDGKRRIQNKK